MALYDEDLAHVHAEGFAAFASKAISALIPLLSRRGVRRVVDVGCGSGITTRALVAAGFETFAIEPSAALLERARRAAPGATFAQASAYEVALPPCDAILALGEPLSYHEPDVDADARVRRFFQAAAAALSAGGLLVFDVIVTGEPTLDARSFARGDDWAVLYETREDAAARRLTRDIETFRRTESGLYRRTRELHGVRVLEPGEVSCWLEQAGFDVETAPAYGQHALARRRLAFFATRRAG